MFTGVKMRANLLFPKLNTIQITKQIIHKLENETSGDIKLPFLNHFVPFVRLLPFKFGDLFKDVI